MNEIENFPHIVLRTSKSSPGWGYFIFFRLPKPGTKYGSRKNSFEVHSCYYIKRKNKVSPFFHHISVSLQGENMLKRGGMWTMFSSELMAMVGLHNDGFYIGLWTLVFGLWGRSSPLISPRATPAAPVCGNVVVILDAKSLVGSLFENFRAVISFWRAVSGFGED